LDTAVIRILGDGEGLRHSLEEKRTLRLRELKKKKGFLPLSLWEL
jgi:hypothetical protein